MGEEGIEGAGDDVVEDDGDLLVLLFSFSESSSSIEQRLKYEPLNEKNKRIEI